MNHHFWGDVSAWFYRCLAGVNVDPDLLDPLTVKVSPKFVSALSFVRAKIEYMGETIKVCWQKTEKGYTVDVCAPDKFRIITDKTENVVFRRVKI